MNFNLFNSIILAGILQGLIYALVVASSKKYKSQGTALLAGLILSFSLDNLQYYFEDIGLITAFELMGWYFIPFELLPGPLLLLCGMRLMQPEKKIRKKQYLLFAPFFVALALALGTFLKIYCANDWGKPAGQAFGTVEELLEYLTIATDTFVISFLLFRLRQFQKASKNNLSEHPKLKRFGIFLIVMAVLSVVWICITIADYYYDTEYWYILYIGMSATIYWIGNVGIYQFGQEQKKKKARNGILSQNGLQPAHKNENIVAVEHLLIAQKRFLDQNVSLESLADELQLSKSNLSRLINSEPAMGFNDYLKSLRVADAQRYLLHRDYVDYSLVAIGLESGFNSKTTFNNAFKKFTAMTPSEFRKANYIHQT